MDYVLPNELVDGMIAAGGKKATVSVKNLLIRGFYSGAILGLAVTLGRLTPEEAFDIAHLDENWQMELSGHDEEEEARLLTRRSELLETGRFIQLLG